MEPESITDARSFLAIHEPLIHYLFMNSEVKPYYRQDGWEKLLICGLEYDDNQIGPPGRFRFFYHTETFNKLNGKFAAYHIIREFLHLLLGHHKLRSFKDTSAGDLACELAANSLLKTFYEVPSHISLPEDKGFPSRQSAEFYYDLIVKERQRTGNRSTFGGPYKQPSQVVWARLSTGRIESLLIKLRSEFEQSSPDLESGALFSPNGHALGRVRIEPGVLPNPSWQTELHMFSARARSKKQKTSYKSYSRRLSSPFPGKTVKYIPEIAVVVDTSSSNEKHFPQIAAVLKDLSHSVKMTVFQADTSLTKVQTEDFHADVFEFEGLGGTDLLPIIQELVSYNEQVLVLTDGKFEITGFLRNTLFLIFEDDKEPRVIRTQ